MKRKIYLLGFSKRKALFLGVVVFAWINLSSAQNNAYNVFIDQDQDGLTDQEELLYGTNPADPDTDHDGYEDGKEIKSGYNPLKPAPGDKLIPDQQLQNTNASSIAIQKPTENLTTSFIEKVKETKATEVDLFQELSQNPESLGDADKLQQLQDISLTQEELESILKETMNSSEEADEMEIIDEKEIKVIARPEGDDEESIKAKEKEQIEEYLVTFGFIMLKNAPFQLQQADELKGQTLSFVSGISSQLQSGDVSQVNQYRSNAETAYNELKAVEVPSVLKDVHIAGLSILNYMLKQDAEGLVNEEDPLNMVLMIGKLQSVAAELEQIGTQVEAIMKEYDITTLNSAAKEVEEESEEDDDSN